MGKIKGFLFAVRHREILLTDLGLIFTLLAYSYLCNGVAKVLSLENEKKCELFFCILLAYSYLCNIVAKVLSLENAKKCELFFCILLAYSYLYTLKQKLTKY